MVTHRFGFEDLPAAFDLVERHPDGLIKAVLIF
jgi:threonine dehydrogenase-like Zn-dependent dehydrogenase